MRTVSLSITTSFAVFGCAGRNREEPASAHRCHIVPHHAAGCYVTPTGRAIDECVTKSGCNTRHRVERCNTRSAMPDDLDATRVERPPPRHPRIHDHLVDHRSQEVVLPRDPPLVPRLP